MDAQYQRFTLDDGQISQRTPSIVERDKFVFIQQQCDDLRFTNGR